jgi:hypothetical protein
MVVCHLVNAVYCYVKYPYKNGSMKLCNHFSVKSLATFNFKFLMILTRTTFVTGCHRHNYHHHRDSCTPWSSSLLMSPYVVSLSIVNKDFISCLLRCIVIVNFQYSIGVVKKVDVWRGELSLVISKSDEDDPALWMRSTLPCDLETNLLSECSNKLNFENRWCGVTVPCFIIASQFICDLRTISLVLYRQFLEILDSPRIFQCFFSIVCMRILRIKEPLDN